MNEQPCPHIIQDTEGTAFCDLAESNINSIAGRFREQVQKLEAEVERLREALQNEGPQPDVVGSHRPYREGGERMSGDLRKAVARQWWRCGDCGYVPSNSRRMPTGPTCPRCRGDFRWTCEPVSEEA